MVVRPPGTGVGYVQIISGNYILSSLSVSAQPPQHVFKLFLHFFVPAIYFV